LIVIGWFNQSIKIDTHLIDTHLTIRQNLVALFLDPGFDHCSAQMKNSSLFFEINESTSARNVESGCVPP